MIGICCYSYYLSQYGDEYPFPRATISGTASHYPQDIPFRLIMMTGGSYLHLTYFILNLWLGHLKK
jgi:hypothetical protein